MSDVHAVSDGGSRGTAARPEVAVTRESSESIGSMGPLLDL